MPPNTISTLAYSPLFVKHRKTPQVFWTRSATAEKRLRRDLQSDSGIRRSTLLEIPGNRDSPEHELAPFDLNPGTRANEALRAETQPEVRMNRYVADGNVPESASTVFNSSVKRTLRVPHPDRSLRAERVLVLLQAGAEVELDPRPRSVHRADDRFSPTLAGDRPHEHANGRCELLRRRDVDLHALACVPIPVHDFCPERGLRSEIHRQKNREKGEQQCELAHRNTP